MARLSQLLLTYLLNACWQALLVAAVTLLCARLLRGTAARYRHALWVAALLLSVGLPALSLRLFDDANADRTARPAPNVTRNLVAPLATLPAEALTEPTQSAAARPRLKLDQRLAAVLLVPYFLFLLYRTVRLCGAWRKTRALKCGARPAALPAHVQAIIRQYQTALAGGAVEILCSDALVVPVTLGARRPLIVVPAQLLAETDAEVLAAAIGHELAHIRRRDYVCNLLYELLYLPLAFHPALALVRRRIGETRELACDELVTDRLLGAHAYARSLMQLAGTLPAFRGQHLTTTTLGITGADTLEERIMTLLGKGPQTSLRRKRFGLLAAALLLVGSCVAATAYTLQIGIDRWDARAVAAPAQEKGQEPALPPAQIEERKKRRAEEKARRDEEQAEMSPAEREARAKREQAEREVRLKTAREAKLTMAQAIQIATNAQAGTVLESILIRERNQACYKVVIISGDEPNTTYTIMLISALDGQILLSRTEHENGRP